MISFWVVFWAGIGFCISYYIAYKKSQKKPLVCVVGFDCNAVVTSRYSTLFGVPNEAIGMLYTGSLILAFFANQGGGLTHVFGYPVIWIVFLISLVALATSVALTYIQAFILKNWCSWCVTAAVMNLFITIALWLAL